MNTDALLTLKERGENKQRKAAKNRWQPPVQADLGVGRLIAIDPSLGACGLVVLSSHAEGELLVRDAAVFKTRYDGGNSTADDLMRASELARLLGGWLIERRGVLLPEHFRIVHELPPEGGGSRGLHHIRSALLAAQVVCDVAWMLEYPVLTPVAVRTHKRYVCGNANADKREHHAALSQIAREWAISGYTEHITNEAKRDSLSVGLYALARREQS